MYLHIKIGFFSHLFIDLLLLFFSEAALTASSVQWIVYAMVQVAYCCLIVPHFQI